MCMCRCGLHSGKRRYTSACCSGVYVGPSSATKMPSVKYSGGSTAHSAASLVRVRVTVRVRARVRVA